MDEHSFFEGVKSYELLAKKEVGQNFLVNPESASKIVSLLEIKPADLILEIGSGAGSLSYFLSLGPAQSVLIDIDEALVGKLDNDFGDNRYVTPLEANALKADLTPYNKILGNLPYYITTSLVEHILLDTTKCEKAAIMVQKEAAARLLAKPGSDDYGPLNILLSYLCDVKKQFNVPATDFVPAPHVNSTVLVFDFKKDADKKIASELYQLTKGLFKNRRKTILNNLKAYLGKESSLASPILSSISLKETLRPEDISPNQYLLLLNCLKTSKM